MKQTLTQINQTANPAYRIQPKKKLPKTPCSILKTLGSISKKNFDDKLKKKATKTLYQEQSHVLDCESTNTVITCEVKITKLDCSADDLHDVMKSEL